MPPSRHSSLGSYCFFKLKAPNDAIAGGGFFTRFLQVPINMVWETFGEANGVKSLPEFRPRIARIRNVPIQPADNPTVGCIMFTGPFFWPKSDGFPGHRNSVSPIKLAGPSIQKKRRAGACGMPSANASSSIHSSSDTTSLTVSCYEAISTDCSTAAA
jgi:hypothetical protein